MWIFIWIKFSIFLLYVRETSKTLLILAICKDSLIHIHGLAFYKRKVFLFHVTCPLKTLTILICFQLSLLNSVPYFLFHGLKKHWNTKILVKKESHKPATGKNTFHLCCSLNGLPFSWCKSHIEILVRWFFHRLFGKFKFTKNHAMKLQDIITNKFVCELQCLKLRFKC